MLGHALLILPFPALHATSSSHQSSWVPPLRFFDFSIAPKIREGHICGVRTGFWFLSLGLSVGVQSCGLVQVYTCFCAAASPSTNQLLLFHRYSADVRACYAARYLLKHLLRIGLESRGCTTHDPGDLRWTSIEVPSSHSAKWPAQKDCHLPGPNRKRDRRDPWRLYEATTPFLIPGIYHLHRFLQIQPFKCHHQYMLTIYP